MEPSSGELREGLEENIDERMDILRCIFCVIYSFAEIRIRVADADAVEVLDLQCLNVNSRLYD